MEPEDKVTKGKETPLETVVSRPRIFSGDESREFWRELNSFKGKKAVSGQDFWSFLYTLSCKLQLIESRLNNLGG